MSKKKMPKKINLDQRYYVVRREFFDIMHDASQAYDKAIITLSTAILGFIFGLLLYKHQILHNFFWIIAGSICFIIAIGLSLYSLWLRQNVAVKGVIHLNNEYDNTSEVSEPFEDPEIKKMEKAQKWSGIFFIIAFTSLYLHFAILIYFAG
jgi:hypothetical protein